jgi:hypothetical protein
MEKDPKRARSRRRKNKITGGERKESYSFTLTPSLMDKVEKEAEKSFISASAQINNILTERYKNKRRLG